MTVLWSFWINRLCAIFSSATASLMYHQKREIKGTGLQIQFTSSFSSSPSFFNTLRSFLTTLFLENSTKSEVNIRCCTSDFTKLVFESAVLLFTHFSGQVITLGPKVANSFTHNNSSSRRL